MKWMSKWWYNKRKWTWIWPFKAYLPILWVFYIWTIFWVIVRPYYAKWLCYLLCNTILNPMNCYMSRNESFFDPYNNDCGSHYLPHFHNASRERDEQRETLGTTTNCVLVISSNVYFSSLKALKTLYKRLYLLYTLCGYLFWRKR